jgi:hypothetical protein
MKVFLLGLTCSLFTICSFSQKTIYHEFEPTASGFKILKWNINKDHLPRLYVQENIDKLGRVAELKFCENGKTMTGQLCYLDTWITYQYPNDSTIISITLDSKGNFGGSYECENPYKVTYHLSKNKRKILKTNEEYFIADTAWYLRNGWTKNKLEMGIKTLLSEQKTHIVVEYYDISYNKLNGLYPVSKEFTPQDYINNSPEGIEIEKALKK